MPFAVSCGYPAGVLPRFFDLAKNNQKQDTFVLPPLAQAITNESTRKASKKLRLIPLAHQSYWQARASKQPLDTILTTIVDDQTKK